MNPTASSVHVPPVPMVPRDPSRFPETLRVEGHDFAYHQTQRSGASAIYRGDSAYLRVGDVDRIGAHLERHRQMESFGFPVARILGEGDVAGHRYFVESSLGDERYGDIFRRECVGGGEVSDSSFDGFAAVSLECAEAALRSAGTPLNLPSFRTGLRVDELQRELPDLAAGIGEAFEAAASRLAVFPVGIVHGDLKPFNLFPSGVIDFEDAFVGPTPFDAATVTDYLDWFPEDDSYEYYRKFRFSPEQVAGYFGRLDALYAGRELPPPSAFREDMTFLKGLWLTVGMERAPKLQAWRRDRLRRLLGR